MTSRPNIFDMWPDAQWPAGVRPVRWAKENIHVVRFSDHKTYAPELADEILAQATDSAVASEFSRASAIGSTKVYHPATWGSEVAAMMDARARALFGAVTGRTDIATSRSWASIYRSGDWVAPHSHLKAVASVLYVLDLGDDAEPRNGRFGFADPRMKACCPRRDGCVTDLAAPKLSPGTMMCFPAKAVHLVTPYYGQSPRITVSWNLNFGKSQTPTGKKFGL